MTIGDVVAIATGLITVGGVLIYIGKSLSTLNTIAEGQKVLFDRADKHGDEITAIKVDVAEVKTRQKDCEHCP